MAGKGNISEEKARKIAVGATIGGVLVIVTLVLILIVQFVQMGVGNSRRARLDEEISQYEQLIDKSKDELEDYKKGSGLYFFARSLGWT